MGDSNEKTSFLRRNFKTINNIAVVLVVLMAVYVKIHDEDAQITFKLGDVYIIAGVFLAFSFLYLFKKRR